MPDTSFDAAIKNRLRSIIVTSGYSVSALSVAMGHSANWLPRKLDGRLQIVLGDIDEVCAFLGVSGGAVAGVVP